MDDPSAPRYLRTMQANTMNPDFMLEAIRLAERGMVKNSGGPFGAVIVREGKIIGRGCNAVTSRNDHPRFARPARLAPLAMASAWPPPFVSG